MSLREQILVDIRAIQHPQLLNQIFEYLQIIKKTDDQISTNRDAVLQYAGVINDVDAAEMLQTIGSEFNKIEGDW